MPVSVNWPMSAGMPQSSSKAIRHDAGPAPQVMISVPSISKRMARYFEATGGLLVVSGPLRASQESQVTSLAPSGQLNLPQNRGDMRYEE